MSEWFKRIAIAVRRTPYGRRAVIPGEALAPVARRIACLAETGRSEIAAGLAERPLIVTGPGAADERAEVLSHCLTALRLPHFLSEHDRLAQQTGGGSGGAGGFDHRSYLLHLATREAAARDRRRLARLIRAAGFPSVRPLGADDIAAGAVLDTTVPQALSECAYIASSDNIIALGGSGADRTHLAISIGLAACRCGFSVRYTTVAALVAELNRAFDERRLLRLYRQLDGVRLLIVDGLGPAPLSPSDAALLFEVFSRRAERGSTLVTSSLQPEAWGSVFGSFRLADAVIERLARRAYRLDLGTAAGNGLAAWLANQPQAHGDAVWCEERMGDRVMPARQPRRAPAGARLREAALPG